nr:hypothetical protein [Planctomycetota bacterium]
ALADYLATCGPRPTTAARLRVGDFNEVTGELTNYRLKNGDDNAHALPKRLRARFSELVRDRRPAEFMFMAPDGEAWGNDSGGRAMRMSRWWLRQFNHLPRADRVERNVPKMFAHPPAWRVALTAKQLAELDDLSHTRKWRGVYNLKRWAITKMDQAGMSLDDIARITGHRSKQALLPYIRSSKARTHEIVDQLPDPSGRAPASPPAEAEPN